MDEQYFKDIFIDREMSWLDFNKRVIELSRDKAVPLAEQLKFAAIYGSNLDEFFMIRIGSLYDQSLLKTSSKDNKTNLLPEEKLKMIMPKVQELCRFKDKVITKLFNRLAEIGYEKVDFATLSKKDEKYWKQIFITELFPVLSPQIVDRRHQFPFLRSLETYIGVTIKSKGLSELTIGLIPVSGHLEKIVYKQEGTVTKFALVEDLILAFAELAFDAVSIKEKFLFRVTRNADISLDEAMFDQDIDYREIMSELLKKRRKLAAIRLQTSEKMQKPTFEYLRNKIVVDENQCFEITSPLDLKFGFELFSRLKKDNKPELFYPERNPMLASSSFYISKELKNRDILVCYPYQSFKPLIKMLNDAAVDPSVISIKLTLYRVATESKIIEALISAAEHGKEVVTIVELRARFDEQNNIDWSKQLENAGCTVIYGFEDYKVHSKIILITKRSKGKISYVGHIGTGNFNEKTSELYTDLSYFTSNPSVCEELAVVFNNLAIEKQTTDCNSLIVAPNHFKSVLIDEIDKEMQKAIVSGNGKITIKCNSISDKNIILKLCEASCAGVKIEIIVRGICCFMSGVTGKTKNIRIRSIVGRYLEHSRIYSFGEDENFRVYIASGDFLTRNTERRVEVGVRIDDTRLKNRLKGLLQILLDDNVNTSFMLPNGSYEKHKRAQDEPINDCNEKLYNYFKDTYFVADENATSVKNGNFSFLNRIRSLFK